MNVPTKRLTPFQTSASVTAGGALALCLVVVLWEILPALLWAGVLVIALWPSYSKICRWRTSHAWRNLGAPLIFTCVVGLVIAAPIALATVEITREARAIMLWINSARHGGAPLPTGLSALPWIGPRVAGWWNANLVDAKNATALFRQVAPSQLLGYTRSVGVEIFHRVLLFVVTLLSLFFLFRDGHSLGARLLHLGKKAFGDRSDTIAHNVVGAIHGTVDGLVLVGLAEGAVIGTGYLIAGLPHAIMFGIATGVLAIIPFGAPLTFCFAAIILFGMGNAIPAALLIVFGFVVVFVADHFIRPILIGGASKVPFLLVLLGLLGGVSSIGLVGLFVGPALMAVLVAVWREINGSATV